MKTVTEMRLQYEVDDESQRDWLVLEGVEFCLGQYGATILDESNYEMAWDTMNEKCDSADWDVVNGFIIVRPGSSAADVAQDIEDRLADYPVLNEDDFSRREHDAYGEAWDNYGRRDFLRLLRDAYGFDDCGAVYCFLDDVCTAEQLRDLFEAGVHSGEYYIPDSDGVSINFRSFDLSRKELAKRIRALRAAHNPRIAWRDPAQGSLFDWS